MLLLTAQFNKFYVRTKYSVPSIFIVTSEEEVGGRPIMSYNTFLAFGAWIGTRETDKATIDDFPFRLHYKAATAVAFLASALLSASELVGMYDTRRAGSK